MTREYLHDYATCAETYATLCIYHHDLNPDDVSRLLELRPTQSQRRGDPHSTKASRPVPLRVGAWFLSTRDMSQSRDVRFHIDLILGMFAGKDVAVHQLAREGCELRMSCYWRSFSGHGGPMMWPETMGRLAELGIEVSFDVYFSGEDEQPTQRVTPETP